MTTTTTQSKPVGSEEPKPAKAKGSKERKGPRIQNGTQDAKRLATAILEVLGGVRLPSEAAGALAITLPRYYQLESRALSGLLGACEPRRIGRVKSSANELAAKEKEIGRLKQECSRYQALVRLAQRTVGLSAPPSPQSNGKDGKRRKRKATVRALKAVEVLQSSTTGEAATGNAGEQPVKE